MFKKAFKDTLPVLAGYAVLGMGFGIIMQKNGYGILWAAAMSLFIYAGSMQYAAVPLLVSSASPVTMLLTTLAVNARHLFYGISMLDKYSGGGIKKTYLIFALTDETYSLVSTSDCGENYNFLVSVLDHFYWVAGTLAGSVIGSKITFNMHGMEFALTALFVTVFIDTWIKTKDKFSAITGIFVSVVSLLLFGADAFLIPAMLGISAVLMIKIVRDKKNA